jgi:hypothetical protein
VQLLLLARRRGTQWQQASDAVRDVLELLHLTLPPAAAALPAKAAS